MAKVTSPAGKTISVPEAGVDALVALGWTVEERAARPDPVIAPVQETEEDPGKDPEPETEEDPGKDPEPEPEEKPKGRGAAKK